MQAKKNGYTRRLLHGLNCWSLEKEKMKSRAREQRRGFFPQKSTIESD